MNETMFALLLALATLSGLAAWGFRQRRRTSAELQQLRAEQTALRTELLSSTRLASLGNLVAGLVHEINTPVGALNSNHDVLLRALERLQLILADEQIEAHELLEVRKIVRALREIVNVNNMAVERVDRLVRSLRSFGRPDEGELAWADLHEGIDSTIAIMQHELGTRVSIVREYAELPRILCRAQQLNQVFLNLLLNACQAITGTGTITIQTARQAGCVRIAIADTGCGIPATHAQRIFEPGFTTKGSRMGMGMGLLITRQIVEQHGGRIEVRSEPQEGSTFIVTLPITPAAQHARTEPAAR